MSNLDDLFIFDVHLLNDLPKYNYSFDCDNCIFVNLGSLKRLKTRNESWLKISLTGQDTVHRFRPSKVVVLDSIVKDDAVFISEQLWFNLNHGNSENHVQNNQHSNVKIYIDIKGAYNGDQKDLYLKQAYVSLINSPEYSADTDFSCLLKTYFNTTRSINKGDVIAIPSNLDVFYSNRNTEQISLLNPIIYFKITGVDGDGWLINTNHTKLYQMGTVGSYIPRKAELYYSFKKDKPLLSDELVSKSFAQVINEFNNFIKPYLKNNLSFGTVLVSGPYGSGKHSVINYISKIWNLHLFEVNAKDILSDSPASIEAKLKIYFSKASIFSPCIMVINNMDILSADRNVNDPKVLNSFQNMIKEALDSTTFPIILMGIVKNPNEFFKSDFGLFFLHHISVETLEEHQRYLILESLLEQQIDDHINIKELAEKSIGFTLGDLITFVSNAISVSYRNVASDSTNESKLILTHSHLMTAFDMMDEVSAETIGAPKIPNVKWEDVGGLEKIKKDIVDTIQLPLKHPQLLRTGLRRSGLLLYGPPGCGKTLLAKAIANECTLRFLSVKGPELINMYVGQSEENVRNIFHKARESAPCVIFFDELDSLAPNRGKSGDSGGVMDRVVSQLLAEMDGINNAANIFIVGATNRPDLIDPALLRPGRFDKLLYVGIATDKPSRMKILKALTKNFKKQNIDLEQIEANCPSSMSGADFYSLCSNAMMFALKRSVDEIEQGNSSEEDADIIVSFDDFNEALKIINCKH